MFLNFLGGCLGEFLNDSDVAREHEVGHPGFEEVEEFLAVNLASGNGCDDDQYLVFAELARYWYCLLYTSPSPRDVEESRMPSSA